MTKAVTHEGGRAIRIKRQIMVVVVVVVVVMVVVFVVTML